MVCPAPPRRSVAPEVFVFALVLGAAACRRGGTHDAGALAAAPAPRAPTPTRSPTALVAGTSSRAATPDLPAARGSTLARVWVPPELREPTSATTSPDGASTRAMFAEDCHAVPWRVVEDVDSATGLARRDLCRAESFDQNCAPDFFGCWTGRESCRAECGSNCLDCESRCGASCMDCRAACSAGDEACLTACGEARADCFEGCAAALDRCKDETCQEGYSRCEAGGRSARQRVCGKVCDKLARCLESADYDSCRARFPKADPRCFEWCLPS
jgi:hypothetical protein